MKKILLFLALFMTGSAIQAAPFVCSKLTKNGLTQYVASTIEEKNSLVNQKYLCVDVGVYPYDPAGIIKVK